MRSVSIATASLGSTGHPSTGVMQLSAGPLYLNQLTR
jgi:hypothetical protein